MNLDHPTQDNDDVNVKLSLSKRIVRYHGKEF
ncbi:hypothetical protein YN1551_0449 [Sulfolobus islandicus Y.N.15.51]|uniref:Uncharacterized protein n=2 Tax=Saccharolobus islandicus TaxID=43080 RepID=C3NL96_SACI1|nr:hypothetical protein YN1551_0449 [Sulfolobus islandicus Y.N.15.51]ADX83601.1 hypothetical protein SiH_2260 [Sulfolobus islandicus HVE10/4]